MYFFIFVLIEYYIIGINKNNDILQKINVNKNKKL